jgi:hypothetical protein
MTIPVGLTREKFNQWEKATSAKEQDAQDVMSSSILDILSHVYSRGDGVISQAGVVNGYTYSLPISGMSSIVTKGLAFCTHTPVDPYDYSISNFCAMLSRDSMYATHDPGDAQDRYDVVWLTPAEADGDNSTVQVYSGGGGPWVSESKPQHVISQPTITVVKGTPSGSPVPPSTAGLQGCELARVLIPAGITDLYGAATVTDRRHMLGRLGELGRGPIPWAACKVIGATGALYGNSLNIDNVNHAAPGMFTITLDRPLPDPDGAYVTATPIVAVPMGVFAMPVVATISTVAVFFYNAAGAAGDPTSFSLEVRYLAD